MTRSLLTPSGGHYIQQLVCDWSEPLHLGTWRAAWEAVSGRHESLRTYFDWDRTGEPMQGFAARVTIALDVPSVPSLGGTDRPGYLARFLDQDRTRGFDLARPPLWRLTAFRWADSEWTTVWTFHHALLDGRSHARVWSEVDTAYRDLTLHAPDPAVPVARPFREFLEWLQTAPTEAAADYWRRRLRGFGGAVGLPSLALSPDSGDDDGPPAWESTKLDIEFTSRLRATAESHGVTLNNLVQGAWALVLARYNSVDDVTFGALRACRHWTREHPRERVGLFINTVPFRVETSPDLKVGDWLRALRQQQLEVRAGEFASVDRIRSWCGLVRGAPFLRTAMMLEEIDPSADSGRPTQQLRLVEKTDLPTLAAYAGTDLTLTLDYSPTRHSADQARLVVAHVAAILRGIAHAAPDDPIGSIPMMTEDERRRVLVDWQGEATPTPAIPIHRVMEAQASRNPSAPAVEFQGVSLSYAELHVQANRLARRLLQLARPGDRVVVVLDRAPEQIVAWLAALKAGMVYAPIDPSSPRSRLEFYLEDLQPAVLLTQSALRPYLPNLPYPVLAVDEADERIIQASLDGSPLEIDPVDDAPVNLLYTSGSTGTPKAAINRFGGLSNFASHVRRTFDIGTNDRVLQASATSFDASLFDFVAALQSGATLVLVPSDRLRPGPELGRLLAELRISVVLLTPTIMRSTPVPPPSTARIVISAGEPLTADLVERWAPGRRLFNVCGPTECSVWSHLDECRPAAEQPTIGRLIENVRGYILDERLQPVPVGVPGELFLGGIGAGLGYWNRPELSAERFIADPFVPGGAALMYRTGDRVRWLADGRVEYLGRLDFQVKVQGVRVELGELEVALRSHPAIADAVMVLHEDRLMAWLIARGTPPTANVLRAWLADRLPLLFAPSEYLWVAEFPRTRTGKADRARLLADWLADQASVNATEQPDPQVDQEALRHLEERNRTERPYPLDRSVLDFIREQVSLRPDAPALSHSGAVMSYGELDRRANTVAHWLLRHGLQPEDIVALRFSRSREFVIAALGVFKAGGSYLPLELNTPDTRLAQILADSGARLALTTSDRLESFGGWNGIARAVDPTDSESPGTGAPEPPGPSDSRRRAYVIYTSGSSGRPKGVEIEHRSLTNLVCFYRERLALTPSDRVTLLANPVFDASVADLWPALCAGATVLIPDAGLLSDPDGLIAWLAAEGATFSFVPTPLGELLLQREWPEKLALRVLCLGGDEMRMRPPAGLPFAVLNSYGPTENTVDAVWSTVSPSGRSPRPPIGRPIANVRAYVLDPALKPVPSGSPGELHLGGVQVARGYLNQPELTRERFLPDPWAKEPGGRMYRTGDQARWNDEGELEFLGRLDDQVQIRGQRVELGEIEAVILQHPKVQEACCRPMLDDGGVRGIEAHVACDADDREDVADLLRDHLAERLPSWMVPAAFIRHPALPLTPQGKVDRAALRKATVLPNDDTNEALRQDSIERALARLWHQLLPESAGAGPDHTFHDLGGDSLQAVKLLLAVEDLTGRRLALSTFLLQPTLAGLCQAVSVAEHDTGIPILALRRKGNGPPLFCLYELWGDVSMYFGLADLLKADHPIYAIRSPALHDMERVPPSIEAAARQVRGWIRQLYPKGEYGLIGYSWGGLLAFEIARQCGEEEGFQPFCALLGTQAPPQSPTRLARLAHALRWAPRWAWRAIRETDRWRLRFQRTGKFLRDFKRNLVVDDPGKLPEKAPPLAYAHIELTRTFRPKVARPVPVHLFRERGSSYGEPHPTQFIWTNWEWDGGWRRWAGCNPTVHWVDGDHWSVLKRPHVDTLAAALDAALRKSFATGG